MDNTIYRQMNWRNSPSKHQTTIMGSCAGGGLCDEKSQNLFDPSYCNRVQAARREFFVTDSFLWYYLGLWSLPYNMYWCNPIIVTVHQCILQNWFKLQDNWVRPEPWTWTYFLHSRGFGFWKFTVKKNGAQLEDRQEFLDGTKKWIMTPFPINQSQSRSRLSGGAIAGIVIACLVLIVLILLAVIMKCLKRHEERQNQHDEENPLSESLL